MSVTTKGHILKAGETLQLGQALHSPNGRYRLELQAHDGNLVLYQQQNTGQEHPTWATMTQKSAGHTDFVRQAVMQSDGNLVLYTHERERKNPRWSSKTNKPENEGAALRLQNDGNLVMYHGDRAVWSSDTWNHSHWMEELADALTLQNICVPGSHDAAMYELDQALTFKDQAWYFQLGEIITQNNLAHIWNFITGKKQEMNGAVATIARRLGLTQSRNLYDQLRAGSRFFDLRPGYRHDTSDFHLLHGKAVGPRLRTVLEDVARFAKENASEVIMLEFSHFENMGDAEETKFVELLTDCIPASLRLAMPRTTALATVPLAELRGKVLLLVNDDNRFKKQLAGDANPGLYRLSGSLPIHDSYANARDYETMRRDQTDKFKKFSQQAKDRPADKPSLFLLNWTLTPVDNDDVKAATGPSVEEYAAQVNPKLADDVHRNTGQLFGRTTSGCRVNILNLDFVQDANPVPLCLEISKRTQP